MNWHVRNWSMNVRVRFVRHCTRTVRPYTKRRCQYRVCSFFIPFVTKCSIGTSFNQTRRMKFRGRVNAKHEILVIHMLTTRIKNLSLKMTGFFYSMSPISYSKILIFNRNSFTLTIKKFCCRLERKTFAVTRMRKRNKWSAWKLWTMMNYTFVSSTFILFWKL
jgi:hypothetical protein